MPEAPMKFCASRSGCASAYTVGAPGTVKIAKDREPIEITRVNDILAFLKERLTPEDFAELQDMVDDMVDDVEEANPTKQMATDGLATSHRRTIRRTVRETVIDGAARRTMAQDAARPRSATPVQDFNNHFPDATRIRSGDNGPQPKRRPGPVMDAAGSKSFHDRFGIDRLKGHI